LFFAASNRRGIDVNIPMLPCPSKMAAEIEKSAASNRRGIDVSIPMLPCPSKVAAEVEEDDEGEKKSNLKKRL